MKSPSLTIVAGLAWFLVSGVALAAPETPLPNVMCPVTPDEAAEQDIWLDHAGTRIHFCCPKCRRTFKASPSSFAVSTLTEPLHSAGHDHQHHSASPERGFREFLGRLHPVSVHFPIALFVMAGICELAFAFSGRDFLRASAGFNLLAGWISGAAAGVLGWINAASYGAADELALLSQHRWSAIALMLTSGIGLTIWPWSKSEKPASTARTTTARIVLTIVVVLTVVTGHLGGSLVFGANHLSW